MSFHPGDEVMHPGFGIGAVLGMRPGARVRVRFERQPHMPRTVRAHEVRLVPETAKEILEQLEQRTAEVAAAEAAEAAAAAARRRPSSSATGTASTVEEEPAEPAPRPRRKRPAYIDDTPVAPIPRRVLDPSDRSSYAQALEALRCGVVPAQHAGDYTVGRERELGRIAELLDEGTGLRVAWGDYGTGKTHLLEVAEQMALEARYMVSRITLDPAEVQPSHPQRLYRAIAEHLRTPGELETGLDPLMRLLAQSNDHRLPNGPRASRFLSPYLYATWLDDPRTLDWARDYAHGAGVDPHEGRYRLNRCGWPGDAPLTLSDFRTYGRVYVHLTTTIASWARDAGFQGLLLLFDEVEFVESCNKAHLEFSREALSHYAAAALPADELGFDPEQDLYRGGQDVHRKLPLRFEEDAPLASVFALTPEPEIEALLHGMIPDRRHDLWLDELGPEQADELVERIAVLFAAAYPEAVPERSKLADLQRAVRTKLSEGESAARQVVQAIVHELDRERLSRRAQRRLEEKRASMAASRAQAVAPSS